MYLPNVCGSPTTGLIVESAELSGYLLKVPLASCLKALMRARPSSSVNWEELRLRALMDQSPSELSGAITR
jgi:hypothetical protein